MEKTNFKGTRGKWHVGNGHFVNEVVSTELNNLGNETICFLSSKSELTDEFNGKLIIDAGNVRQQINFDLPELLKQRNEMLDMLEHTVNALYMAGSKGDLILAKEIENLIQQSKV